MSLSNRDLYDAAVSDWRRYTPLLLSDFTAKPRVIQALGRVDGLHLWDLGCGEGFVGRQLALGTEGFDFSAEMITTARE